MGICSSLEGVDEQSSPPRQGWMEKALKEQRLEQLVVIKAVMVGETAVGKSSLLQRFTKSAFKAESTPTIGVDLIRHEMDVDGRKVRFTFWDTAGQARFRAVTRSYYKDAQAVFIVYDITDRNSFTRCKDWLQKVQDERPKAGDSPSKTPKRRPVILIGNKADLEGNRVVSAEEGKQLAKLLGAEFYETSAKADSNVAISFEALARQVLLERIQS